MTENFTEITAAGTVQDSHLVPYYPIQVLLNGTIITTNIQKTFAYSGRNFFNSG